MDDEWVEQAQAQAPAPAPAPASGDEERRAQQQETATATTTATTTRPWPRKERKAGWAGLGGGRDSAVGDAPCGLDAGTGSRKTRIELGWRCE
ncbi:hypothetical protein CKAH01_03320 [Colletotrichum kahawae]|uniref:Uncharacterized protein n=1 Tax=Colletotrichum kahawae TaxID=34407 RepID=A0AAE0DBB3_COLKA|nr:hypothetical protein CKAH01_03320 [Colletotrichum kahawae]